MHKSKKYEEVRDRWEKSKPEDDGAEIFFRSCTPKPQSLSILYPSATLDFALERCPTFLSAPNPWHGRKALAAVPVKQDPADMRRS